MDSETDGLVRAYCACLQAWNASYEEHAKSVGLSYTSLSILTAIDETENCTQKKLCARCFLPKQTVNAAVTALYKKGWIVMREWPEDRRNKTIHFTPQGQAEAERILAKVHQSERAAMGSLSKGQRAQLLALTEQYMTACRRAMKGP